MDKANQKQKGKLEICKGIGECGLGAFMLFLASVGKDSWEYYIDSDRQAIVDIASIFGWLGLFLGIIGIVYGVILLCVEDTQSASVKSEEKEERIDWFEGEIVDKEWNPERHQVEWITLRQRNGLTIRLWHYIADDKVYKIGDRGRVRAKDRLIAEFIPSEYES